LVARATIEDVPISVEFGAGTPSRSVRDQL
jgi:hypothetical protein